MRRNGADGARGWGVYRHGAATADGQRLAFQHPIAGVDAQLAFGPQMLLQRNDKGLGQGATRSGTPLDCVFISGGWIPPSKSQIRSF